MTRTQSGFHSPTPQNRWTLFRLAAAFCIGFLLVPALFARPVSAQSAGDNSAASKGKPVAKSATARKQTPKKATRKPAPLKKATVKVWVNTDSGVYHFPGMRWYGATKNGTHMSEDEAKVAGYRPTHNGQ